jgi:hypothetical protein
MTKKIPTILTKSQNMVICKPKCYSPHFLYIDIFSSYHFSSNYKTQSIGFIFLYHLNSNESTILFTRGRKVGYKSVFSLNTKKYAVPSFIGMVSIVFSRSTVKVYESDMLAVYTNVCAALLPPSSAGVQNRYYLPER